ncbi:MAG: hypothetical protein M5U28_45045 [Sandaracinaceae bacterium]|nr:hypothetical protein [Sandaracinaceae bacterium]
MRAPRGTTSVFGLRVCVIAALLSAAGCDAEDGGDAGSPPNDGGARLDGASPDAGLDGGGATDGTVTTPDGGTVACTNHHHCDQGAFCHRGACRTAELPTYHCGRPGCPPGQWCVESDGTRSVCAADPTYACESACDCGPAHCCLEGRCVRDEADPWSGDSSAASACPVGPDVPPAERAPTYCATDPACFAGAQAWSASGRRGTFLAYDPETGAARPSCGASRCFGTACNCELGQSCVEAVAETLPGTACDLFAGGTCVSNALAESVFGFTPDELLGCCADGCRAGERCEMGWMRRGNRRAYERVVAECPAEGACACGDGRCCPEEIRSCPTDCMPERCSGGTCAPIECGDGRCDPFEDDRRCPADCAAGCGDGTCSAGESAASCFTDCQEECGDGWCSAAELTDIGSCPSDCDDRCLDAYLYSRVYRVCGDGVCDRTGTCDYADPETCQSCPQDCGSCDWEMIEIAPDRPVQGPLGAVWVSAPDDVLVATGDGRIFHRDAAGWHLEVRLDRSVIRALWSAGATSRSREATRGSCASTGGPGAR